MFSSSVRTLLNLLPLLLPITDTAAIPTGLAPLTPRAVKCGKEQRIAGAKCVPFAYNQPDIGASTQGFIDCPFADDLQTYLYPRTGVPGIHVGRTGNQLRAAAIATRQVFSHVEGSYIDFAKNSTTDLVVDIVSLSSAILFSKQTIDQRLCCSFLVG